MDSLMKNKTWDIVPLPEEKRALPNKWVYRLKKEEGGQKRYDLHLEQLDVKTTFLHGDLEEEIYMLQPQGYEVKGKENLVCRLKKSLYGLKQAPRQCYIILLLYVYDMLIAGSNMQHINDLKQKLARSFAMKDLGVAKQILGMRITRDRKNRTLNLSQSEYIKKVLKRLNMQDAKAVSTPLASHFKLTKEMCPKAQEKVNKMSNIPYSSVVGSLMYAMVCTRPDIAHAVGVVSRFMSNPGSNTALSGSVDSDLVGDIDSRRSTTGYVFTIGGTTVSWISRLQKVVALSTTEAEYVAATEASKEMIWLTKHIQLRYHFIRTVLEEGQLRLEKIHTSDGSGSWGLRAEAKWLLEEQLRLRALGGVKKDIDFSEVYMDSIVKNVELGDGGVGLKPKVGFTVMPRFQIGKTIVQCQVYLIGRKSID
ncbi:hypothetical protein SUGI_0632490 [Cryptomeria japonica]|nr:hypothetical protein SUGI_0632490 [Cryptomeria japonica]